MAHRTINVTVELSEQVLRVIRDHNGGNEPPDDLIRAWLRSFPEPWAAMHWECDGAYCPSLQEMLSARPVVWADLGPEPVQR